MQPNVSLPVRLARLERAHDRLEERIDGIDFALKVISAVFFILGITLLVTA